VILGASFDSVDKNRAFADKFGYSFKLLCDTEKSLASYGAIDPDDPEWPRRISYLIGPTGTILEAYAKVTVATHATQVLADIERHRAA